jgi:hypothetical protein
MTRGTIAALVGCGLILACSTPDKTNPDKSASPRALQPTWPEKSQPMNPCSEPIRKLILEGDLSTPLAPECQRADVIAVLGEGTEGAGKLSGKPHTWLLFPGPEQGGSTRAWFEKDTLLLLVVTKPRIKGPISVLLAQLGEPEGDLDSRTTDFDHFVRDRVYAGKGMTLTVGRPFKGDAEPVVLAAFYYAPTTPDAYVTNLGGKDPWVRKLPPR